MTAETKAERAQHAPELVVARAHMKGKEAGAVKKKKNEVVGWSPQDMVQWRI